MKKTLKEFKQFKLKEMYNNSIQIEIYYQNKMNDRYSLDDFYKSTEHDNGIIEDMLFYRTEEEDDLDDNQLRIYLIKGGE